VFEREGGDREERQINRRRRGRGREKDYAGREGVKERKSESRVR
jgi:hypothetical protein